LKGIYITSIDIVGKSGYNSKIIGQLKALSKYSSNMYILASNGKDFFLAECKNDTIQIIERRKRHNNRISYIRGLLNQRLLVQFALDSDTLYNFDYFYIRRIIPITNVLIKMLKILKKRGKKIFYEYPTYPWKEEMRKNFGGVSFILDCIYYRKLLDIVDYIPAIMVEHPKKSIEKDKFIKISNGIDINKIPKKKKANHNGLNILALAHLQNWHGYDRVLRGLSEYYSHTPKREVRFLIVGEGAELTNLKKLTKELNLEEHVLFFGEKTGKELDSIFDDTDVAVSSIANHRKGMFRDSSLKSREYCARGIPFVIASDDDDFPETFRYVHRIPKNDEAVNIDELIDFFDSIKDKNYVEEMRNYARDKLSWTKKMKPVIDKILSLDFHDKTNKEL